MRIVIDMQAAQTEGRLLGAARYATAFAQAIIRNREEHEVFLTLSGLIPNSIEPIRAAFDGILAQENIRVWYAPIGANPGNAAERNIAALLKEAFITSLNPDIVHIFALDEEHVDSELVSIYRFEKNTPVTIALDVDTSNFTPKNIEAFKPANMWVLFSESEDFESNIPSEIKKPVINILKKSLKKDSQNQFDHSQSASIAEVISSWEKLASAAQNTSQSFQIKKTLAFISPMPPERTGIADYSAELLPELSKYYEIVLIVEQNDLHPSYRKKFQVKDSSWLLSHKHLVDRVLYQVGNAPYHQHMLDLIKEIPGTVVLHDFYLGHLRHWKEVYVRQNEWYDSLYESHGYPAIMAAEHDIEGAKNRYPVNFDLIKNSNGLIVHSEFSKNLIYKWYGFKLNVPVSKIPLLRASSKDLKKTKFRKNLKIKETDFVVCSFGFMGPSKQNLRLLKCWLDSPLATQENSHLIFVGENSGGAYGEEVRRLIESSSAAGKVHITGFASQEIYKQYLYSADIAVQLRTDSRGETSATVLDCMNYRLPLIANANGSMSELDENAVYLLQDEFSDAQLVNALEELWKNPMLRKKMGDAGKRVINMQHSPEKCAQLYKEAIESQHQNSPFINDQLIDEIAKLSHQAGADLKYLAECLDKNSKQSKPAKRLFLDITATCNNDLKTGIERVARALTIEMIKASDKHLRVEPIYLKRINEKTLYFYARDYTSKLLKLKSENLKDEVADIGSGDIILGLDISGTEIIEAVESGYIQLIRDQGAKVYFTVFDLLPIRLPEVFPLGANENHEKWLKSISTTDGIIAISKHVSDDFIVWLNDTQVHKSRKTPFKTSYFHLGADIDNSAPSVGMPENSEKFLEAIQSKTSFLMVGTIEPRKAYGFTLDAFEYLWSTGVDINLVIVGKEGWIGLPDHLRRDIPKTMDRLRNHAENGKRLFVLEGISDEYLNNIYSSCSCLIASSYDEGFGLPLIEAAQHGLPIIARDIPVFREVAGDHAFYFDSRDPDSLAEAIKQWMNLYVKGKHPCSENIPWFTWSESSENLKKIILKRAALDEPSH